MRALGRSFVFIHTRMAIHMGTIAMMSAARAEGTHCSAQLTSPLPPRMRATPTMLAESHWRPVGIGSPAARRQARRRPPAMSQRALAMRNGGISSTAKRIARYVDPQMT
jgi:hypothetical protein